MKSESISSGFSFLGSLDPKVEPCCNLNEGRSGLALCRREMGTGSFELRLRQRSSVEVDD